MMAAWARRILFTVTPSGKKRGKTTEDMKSRLIRGTPRIISMYTMHSALTALMREARPRASSTPSG